MSSNPQALVGNNHHVPPFPGEDFQMFEKDLPGGNTAGFNADSKPADLPLETCETINNSWGYNQKDKKLKSTAQLLHYLIKAAGMNANFLLNIGPRPDGTIQPEFVERLQAMGKWLDHNGESIYATRGGPVPPQPWGVTTQSKDGNKIYVHVLDPNVDRIRLTRSASFHPGEYFDDKGTAKLLTGDPVRKDKMVERGELQLQLPQKRDPIDTIVVLEKTQ
jgi:alpha-L-fucosidase